LAEHDPAHHHHAAHHERAAVALVVVQELREPERAAGASLVLELRAADDAGFLHGRCQVAAGLVPAAPGVGRDHHLQGAEALGPGRPGYDCLGSEQRSGSQIELTALHASISSGGPAGLGYWSWPRGRARPAI